MHRHLRLAGTVWLISALFLGATPVAFAQTAPTAEAKPTLSREERLQLEAQLAEIQKEIDVYEAQLKQATTERKTLTSKLNQLKKQQSSLTLQIRATSLKIDDLGNQIEDVMVSISEHTDRIERLKYLLGKFLQLIREQNATPLWYRMVTASSIAQAVGEYQEYLKAVEALEQVRNQIAEAKQGLETKQVVLAEQQDEAQNLLSIKTLQQQKLLDSVKAQDTLLKQTKGKESSYQASLSDAQKRAAQIRSRIYNLLDVSTQINFGQALEIAEWVSGATGVRPAFLLAVLTQESNLGKNVGTCNRLGDPPNKSWKVVMKPERDQEPFETITAELGMDPDVTPVSCPMRDRNGKQIGWGGAMGPAQFIPSTWMGYRDKVKVLTGRSVANPWDIRDAFVASAIKLKSDGANGTRQGEWSAAMRYFSGSTNTKFRFYGDSVLALADGYQEDIDELKQ